MDVAECTRTDIGSALRFTRHIAKMTNVRTLACACLLGASNLPPAAAQEYPVRPIRFIVPNAPGGGTDITARAVGQKLTAMWGQHVVVDNRAGGTGTIGLDMAAKAPADGYTIVLVTGTHTARRATHRKLPYDLLRDFAPVTQMTAQSYVLVINSSLAAKSIEELVFLSKQKPEGLTYGSSGQGSLQHLSGALLAQSTRANLLHVPYKGGGPALADVLAGHISMVFATPLESVPHIKSGRLRALAVTGSTRSRVMPALPTVAEVGVPGYEVTNWYGVLAPIATPGAVVIRLNQGIVAALKAPDIAERFLADGVEPIGTTIERFQAHIRAEIEKWERVVAAAGITAE
jgi:tripartite-type tricarboxylate transporter receptor subunit TctC